MKHRYVNTTTLLALLALSLLVNSCHSNGISPSIYTLLVKQCNNPALTLWPRDLSIDVYYFSPETNMDDAFDEVANTFGVNPPDYWTKPKRRRPTSQKMLCR